MGKTIVPTWLPRDRWAQILGISPLHFNQLVSAVGPFGDCGDVWFQYAWQRPDLVSREDVDNAIHDAESKIADEIRYNLLPDWVVDERVQTIRPAAAELYSHTSVTVRGQAKAVEARKGYVISGGQRATSLIEAGAAVVVTDADGDGYSELCTITVTTDISDCEIRVFYPGEDGSWDWEVRPIKISSTGGVATITFNRWLIVDPDSLVRLDAGEPAQQIDADINASYLSTVDIYRIFNDPQSQVNFLWERDPIVCGSCNGTGCVACSFSTQTGCLFVRDERLGILAYRPASWDSVNERFNTANFTVGRDPEQLRMWYYSGWESKDPRTACPRRDMDPYWEKAVAYLSIALLDREVCNCNNVERFFEYWREDKSRSGADVSYQVSAEKLDNPFGPTRGGIYAWEQAKRDGRRIRK